MQLVIEKFNELKRETTKDTGKSNAFSPISLENLNAAQNHIRKLLDLQNILNSEDAKTKHMRDGMNIPTDLAEINSLVGGFKTLSIGGSGVQFAELLK